MSEPAIELRGLSHRFGGGEHAVSAVQGISLSVAAGSFVSVVGPSGCGKSTLLRVLAGLLVPTAGQALVRERSAIATPGLVGYMPQRDLLLPWRRALANATLGAEIAGEPVEAEQERARGLFQQFGLAGFEDAWPAQLSGGMRQRLALLRTFLIRSDVLLLDEPFGALDAITRRAMQVWLQDVWMRDRRTVLFVTHDVEEALFLSDTVYVLTERPGRLLTHADAPFARPRLPSLVVEPAFVQCKARLLAALDRGS